MPAKFTNVDAIEPREVMPGTTVQALTGQRLQLVRTTLAPGGVFATHTHSHEQFIYVLEGALEFTIGDETQTLEAGGVFYMAPDVAHGARVVSDRPVVLIEVFHPVREDYSDDTTAVSHEVPR
ncbi:MAG: cupin domain-containing protein [Myxococcota bacterium]